MKKFFLVLVFHCMLGLAFQSCIKCPDQRITGSDSFIAAGVDDLFPSFGITELDTLAAPFAFKQNYATESVAFTQSNVGLNTAYAWSCGTVNTINSIREESFNLTFNKDFEFLGDVYLANTNLLESPGLNDYILLDYVDINRWAATIYFEQLFYDEVNIPSGDMLVRFTSETEDGVLIESELTVFMDL